MLRVILKIIGVDADTISVKNKKESLKSVQEYINTLNYFTYSKHPEVHEELT